MINQSVVINAAVVSAMIKAMGMTAENEQRMWHGNSMAYDYDAFSALIDEEGIGHNAVMLALSWEG